MSKTEPTFTTVVLIGIVVMLLFSVVMVATDGRALMFGEETSNEELR